jgi:hypothetical protein
VKVCGQKMPIYSFKLRSDENLFADDAGLIFRITSPHIITLAVSYAN